MLQDLDSLAARIGQLVQFTQQLQGERAAMQARLKSLEQERDVLRDQLQLREAEIASVAEVSADHETQLEALRAEALAAQSQLQQDVVRYKADYETIRQQLQASQNDSSRLRGAADKARTQIDSILMRLPGAAQE
ncbi:hypothetical protein [Allopusillimonas ginsengisoli]|uniref:hypothetical protein n=1 Tax=Allopusillimonas ginsengisoli TaxID=453575 RepID=UPI001021BD5A|nr:hypothetical protein [Allopusillimonas ginsengisoli]TEA78169.1 hypothetical protein ERE07_10120 [Allopusillimonas ginsengisoli]